MNRMGVTCVVFRQTAASTAASRVKLHAASVRQCGIVQPCKNSSALVFGTILQAQSTTRLRGSEQQPPQPQHPVLEPDQTTAVTGSHWQSRACCHHHASCCRCRAERRSSQHASSKRRDLCVVHGCWMSTPPTKPQELQLSALKCITAKRHIGCQLAVRNRQETRRPHTCKCTQKPEVVPHRTAYAGVAPRKSPNMPPHA
jgi:hypothetical protein